VAAFGAMQAAYDGVQVLLVCLHHQLAACRQAMKHVCSARVVVCCMLLALAQQCAGGLFNNQDGLDDVAVFLILKQWL
jgi:hypothetical protein